MLSLENNIEEMASLFEQANNLMLLSDPLLSLGAMLLALALACAASFFLFFISPNTFVFLMGLALFAPDNAVLRTKVLVKGALARATRGSRSIYKHLKRKNMFGLGGPPLVPGEYLHRLALETTLPVLKSHEKSGFLYSKAWPDRSQSNSSDKDGDKAKRAPKELHWSSHWCEIWQVPGVMKVTVKSHSHPAASKADRSVQVDLATGVRGEGANSGVVSMADKKREVVTCFDLENVTASYL